MKNQKLTPAASVASPDLPTDNSKLVSLLALATGAVVMPQTGNADIIYTDLNSGPVLVGYAGTNSYHFDLPGTADFGFQRSERVATIYGVNINYRTVIAGNLAGGPPTATKIQGVFNAAGFVNALAVPQPFDAVWDEGLALFNEVKLGSANTSALNPATGYDKLYLAWQFADSTQLGALRYGWAQVSLSMAFNNTPGGGPNVTIWGYAYDDTGAKINMGQTAVPEPTSMALIVLGALTFGARGLRSWRRNRDTVGQT